MTNRNHAHDPGSRSRGEKSWGMTNVSKKYDEVQVVEEWMSDRPNRKYRRYLASKARKDMRS